MPTAVLSEKSHHASSDAKTQRKLINEGLAVAVASATCFLMEAALIIYQEFTGELKQYVFLHMFLYGSIRAITQGQLEQVLLRGSAIFASLIPNSKRTETVTMATQFLTFFFWLPGNAVAVYRVLYLGSMAEVREHCGLVVIGPVVLVVDALLEMTKPSVWQFYAHHMAAFALCVFCYDMGHLDYGLGMYMLQWTMDRAVTPAFLIHRMSLYRDKHRVQMLNEELTTLLAASGRKNKETVWQGFDISTPRDGVTGFTELLNDDSTVEQMEQAALELSSRIKGVRHEILSKSQQAAGNVDLMASAVIVEYIDRHLLQKEGAALYAPLTASGKFGQFDQYIPSARNVPRIFTIVFIVYVVIARCMLVSALSTYCYFFWSEISTTWKIIHPFGMLFFIAVDIDVYQLLWRRSGFSSTVKKGLQNTVYQPTRQEMQSLKDVVRTTSPVMEPSKDSAKPPSQKLRRRNTPPAA